MPNSRKILIVDDDTELRNALVEQLSLHDEFEAVSVDSGTKGVQEAKAGQIDLVIMDVGLPDMDGRELCRLMRNLSLGELAERIEGKQLANDIPDVLEGVEGLGLDCALDAIPVTVDAGGMVVIGAA